MTTRQGPHHVAQKSSSTTCPRSDASEAGNEPLTASTSLHGGANAPTRSMRSMSSCDGKAVSTSRVLCSRPPRANTTSSASPTACALTTWITSLPCATGVPATRSKRSPSRSPAFSAGEPRITWVTWTPPVTVPEGCAAPVAPSRSIATPSQGRAWAVAPGIEAPPAPAAGGDSPRACVGAAISNAATATAARARSARTTTTTMNASAQNAVARPRGPRSAPLKAGSTGQLYGGAYGSDGSDGPTKRKRRPRKRAGCKQEAKEEATEPLLKEEVGEEAKHESRK